MNDDEDLVGRCWMLAAERRWRRPPRRRRLGPAASAPRMGMGPGGGMAWAAAACVWAWAVARAGADYTPGWGLMTPAERNEHRTQMRSAKSYEDCVALRDKHREQMPPRQGAWHHDAGAARRDVCQGLKR